MGLTRTLGTGGIPVWQGTNKDIQLVQGGVTLVTTGLVPGTVIPAGTPVVFVEGTTRTGTVLHSGFLYENAASNAVNYKVRKNHTFVVGDYLASGATGGKAYAITAIDRTNADYDTLTVGTTIGAVDAGASLYASTATGATASALPACNGLLYDDAVVAEKTGISVAIRGTIYARRVIYNASIEALAGLKGIIYSQSY